MNKDVFPIEHGGVFQCHVSFQGCILQDLGTSWNPTFLDLIDCDVWFFSTIILITNEGTILVVSRKSASVTTCMESGLHVPRGAGVVDSSVHICQVCQGFCSTGCAFNWKRLGFLVDPNWLESSQAPKHSRFWRLNWKWKNKEHPKNPRQIDAINVFLFWFSDLSPLWVMNLGAQTQTYLKPPHLFCICG